MYFRFTSVPFASVAFSSTPAGVVLGKLVLVAVALGLSGCAESPAPVEMASPSAAAPEAPQSTDPRPAGFVLDGAEWELVSEGYVYTDAPAMSPSGELFFAAPIQNRIYRMAADDRIEVFADNTEMAMGLTFGADGLLYGCSNRGARIVAYAATGVATTLYQGELTPLPDKPKAPGEFCNDVAVSAAGNIWYTDRVNKRVMSLNADGDVRAVADGFRPNGIVLSADGALLVVTDSLEPVLRAFEVSVDGSLRERTEFFPAVRTLAKLGNEDVQGRPGTNGMTVDAAGRFYVTSFYGIQIFANDGQYLGVIEKPTGFISNLVFAGPERKTLFATGINGIWRLPMQVQGAAR